MHFLDTWTELAPADLVRLLAPAVLLVLSILLPGRRVARPAAALIGIGVIFLAELGSPALRFGWLVLWSIVAWQAGTVSRDQPIETTRRAGSGAESGLVGLLLGLALLAVLTAGVARQDLSPEDGRRASWGLMILGLGLLHLMVRRHAQRALIAFAAMGLGLQMLDGASRGAQLPHGLPPSGAVLVATAAAVALVTRVSRGRKRIAGSAWISDAHDLHD